MTTVRTTVELDKDLLKKAKQKAVEEDKTLKQLVESALKKEVENPEKRKRKIKIRTYDMGEIKGTLSREEIYEEHLNDIVRH
jgi:predicted transcriptional regulator